MGKRKRTSIEISPAGKTLTAEALAKVIMHAGMADACKTSQPQFAQTLIQAAEDLSGTNMAGQTVISIVKARMSNAIPQDDLGLVKQAVDKFGQDAKPDTIIAFVRMGNKKTRDLLRELERRGEYKGFGRPRPQRFQGSEP